MINNYRKLITSYSIFILAYFFIAFSANIHSQEDIEIDSPDTNDESSSTKEMSSLDKCMMKAESNKEKKKCIEDNMSTIEEFMEDEGLSLIEGYLKIFADEDKTNYYLKLNKDDLDQKFLYFSYIMNAPQGSSLTGGSPSDGKVLEFRNFQKNKIGLYQINTSYINGDDNNIGRSSITNITEAFIETFQPVARSEDAVLISVNKFMMSEKIEAISYVPEEYREYVSVNYGRPNPKKTFINKVFNNKTNTAVEVIFGYENKMPSSDAYAVSAVTDPRYLSVTGRHIFIKMPGDGFEPRVNDHRVGYFVNKATDLTSYENFPNFALINVISTKGITTIDKTM